MNIIAMMLDDGEPSAFYDPVAQPFLYSQPGGSWIIFPNAVCSTPLCAPSRHTLATGQRSDHHRQVGNDKVDPVDMTDNAPMWLAAANPSWATAFFGKLPNGWPWDDFATYDPGYQLMLANSVAGMNFYDWTAYDETGATVSHIGDGVYFIDHITDLAVDFIETATQPFILRLDPGTPHGPAIPATRHAAIDVGHSTAADDPPDFNVQIANAPAHMVFADPGLSEQDKTEARARRVDARRCMLAVDEMFEAIFTALEVRGILDDTAIFICNDNGQAHGRHRIEDGKQRPYRWCSDAALRVRWPMVGDPIDGRPTRVDNRLVTLADLPVTWAAMGGATPTISVDGIDIQPLLNETADGSWRSSIESCFLKNALDPPNWWSVLYRTIHGTEFWRYTEYSTGEKELFDQNTDPYELTNVAAAPANADMVTFLSKRLGWRASLSEGMAT